MWFSVWWCVVVDVATVRCSDIFFVFVLKQVHDLEVSIARKSFIDNMHALEEGEEELRSKTNMQQDDEDPSEKEITAKNLWRAIRKYGPGVWGRKKTAEIKLSDVEEMIYDADSLNQSGDMKVDLNELLNVLEMVATEEIKEDLGKSEQGMIRVPTGRHLAALMNMESASDTLVNRARKANISRPVTDSIFNDVHSAPTVVAASNERKEPNTMRNRGTISKHQSLPSDPNISVGTMGSSTGSLGQ